MFIYNLVIELRKDLKNTWRQGQHRKVRQLSFYCCPLGKVIYRKRKEKYKEETQKTLKGTIIFEQRKNKNKKLAYPDYALTLTFPL